MGMRMTGLISGMDTESMVKELVNASSEKVNKVKKEKQKMEWKQEAWKDLNTKIYNFYKTSLYNMRYNGSFTAKKATSADETKVKVTANANSANGTHMVSVKQLASSAYLTGENIKSRGNSYTSYGNAASSTNFADMTDKYGNSLNLEGSEITISNGNDLIAPLTFTLGGDAENSVANLDELNAKLAENEDYKGLKASFDKDGNIVFTNSSLVKNEDGTETGSFFTVKSTALGIDGSVSFKADEESGDVTSISGTVGLKKATDFTSADINTSTKLSDLGIQVGTTFSVKGKDFVVDENTTIADFTSGISKLGVSMTFDAKQGRFYMNSADTGSEYDFNITASVAGVEDSDALDILGLGSGATKIDAQDAVIEYNGVEYRSNGNNIEINGLSITARGVTGEYQKSVDADGNEVFTKISDSPISIEVGADTQGVYDSIKKFVTDYNALIDEMNTLYNESKTDYEPLTDEERSKLSETQIEQWEKKAKQGLFRRDETINKLLSTMRTVLNQGVEVTDKDGNTKTLSLAALGIVTGNYSENGKLHIMGDEDDAEYSAQENKLKAYLESDPDTVRQIFAGSKEKPGVAFQMYDSLTKAMARSTTSRSLTFYNDITMEEQLKDKDEEIDKWEEKLKKMEDKYYDQFAAMESAMAELQMQQSYISSLMGSA